MSNCKFNESTTEIFNNVSDLVNQARRNYPEFFLSGQLRLSIPRYVCIFLLNHMEQVFRLSKDDMASTEIGNFTEGSSFNGITIQYALEDVISIGHLDFMSVGDKCPNIRLTDFLTDQPKWWISTTKRFARLAGPSQLNTINFSSQVNDLENSLGNIRRVFDV